MKLDRLMKTLKRSLNKNMPTILTGLGITGYLSAVIFSSKAAPLAKDAIEEKKKKQPTGELTVRETIEATYKYYIPTAVSFLIATGCIIGAASMSNRRTAALATAYSLSETAFRTYKGKVIESLGNRKEASINDAVAKEQILKAPVAQSHIIMTGRGDTLCFDALSGQYFMSDIERIRRAENDINHRLLDEMYLSVNEFYDELGISRKGFGDEMGWNVNQQRLEITFSTQLTEDGRPCLVLNYDSFSNYRDY